MRILFIPRLFEEILDMVRKSLPSGAVLEVISRDAEEEEIVRAVGKADVIMGYVMGPFSPKVLDSMKHVKLLQLLSAGYDKVDIEAMRKLCIPVATNGGANSVAVAEHTIMLILALYRKLIDLNGRVKAGQWATVRPGSEKLFELEGKQVGLVGFGSIGREVAKRVSAFEAIVKYYDVFRADPSAEESLKAEYAPLKEIVSSSDVLSLHCPLTKETRHMIGRSELQSMKKSAVIINTARGGLVDHNALYEELRDGNIAGAGLDVVDPIPPPADMAILTLNNVIVTPHTAGTTVESWPKRFRNAFENIRRVSEGLPPFWIVPELRDLG